MKNHPPFPRINCEKGAKQLKIKAQVSSICAKGCMLDDCMCVIWLDTTRESPDLLFIIIIIIIIIITTTTTTTATH